MSKLKDPNDSLRPCSDGGVGCKNVGNGSKSTQCFLSLWPSQPILYLPCQILLEENFKLQKFR